jgi:hypothetical protein
MLIIVIIVITSSHHHYHNRRRHRSAEKYLIVNGIDKCRIQVLESDRASVTEWLMLSSVHNLPLTSVSSNLVRNF